MFGCEFLSCVIKKTQGLCGEILDGKYVEDTPSQIKCGRRWASMSELCLFFNIKSEI